MRPHLMPGAAAGDSVDIRHLRYFLAVAETQNFTRAAQRLRITQPSISQAVAQLERALGAALFRRMGKRVQLTEAGASFRASAEVVLRKLDEARASVRDVTGLLTGHVDIGVIPALHVAWLPWVLERMSHAHPGVTIRVVQRSSSDVETELEAGRLDLGLGLATHASPGIRYEPLVSEPFSLLVGVRSPFARCKRVRPRELESARLVLLPNTFDMRRAADELMRRHGVRPKVVYEIDNIDSVLAAAARADTPTILPAIVLRGRKALGLRAVPIAAKGARMQFGLLWPLASSASPAALTVAAVLRALLPSLREGGRRRRTAPR
jgi:LysR family transcriptional regulator, cyn operon transcriptional activator